MEIANLVTVMAIGVFLMLSGVVFALANVKRNLTAIKEEKQIIAEMLEKMNAARTKN